jgi:hypothetical protein
VSTGLLTTKDAQAFLKNKLSKQQRSLAVYHTSTGAVWLRKAAPHHSIVRYLPLYILAYFLRRPIFRPVPSLGGSQAILIESVRLNELSAAGVNVPRMLAANGRGLLMTDIGQGQSFERLDTLLHKCTNAQSFMAIFTLAFDEICHVHHKGQYLSQPFARNIVLIGDKNIGFIDFEDDPLSVMPLVHCQARDLLCFLFSVANELFCRNLIDDAAQYVFDRLINVSPSIQTDFIAVTRLLSFIKWLPKFVTAKDIHKTRCLYAFMSSIITMLQAGKSL